MDLDVIDWGALEDARGPATELPALLAQAAQGDAGAVEELRDRVAHQGWIVPEAARVVVPFLWELTGHGKADVRAGILALLADLSCVGDHAHFVGTRVTEASAAFALLGGIAAEVRDAVRAGGRLATGKLGDRSPAVRSAAALLLAVAGIDGAAGALAGRLAKEKSAQARVEILIALGWACADAGIDSPAALREALVGPDPTVAAAAAIGLGYSATLDDALLGALTRAASSGTVAGGAWLGGDLGAHAVAVLIHAARQTGRDGVLADLLDVVDDRTRVQVGAALVRSGFRGELARLARSRAAAPFPAERLTPDQRSILEAISRFDTGWVMGNAQRSCLERLGLPLNPPKLRAFLGHAGPPPTVVDRVVELGGESAPIGDWLVRLATHEGAPILDAAHALARLLTPVELVELTEEGRHVEVPFARAAAALFVHALVAGGEAVREPLTARLVRLGRDGPPARWSDYGLTRDTSLGLYLFVALRALDPGAALPDGVELPDFAAKGLRAHAADYGAELASWVVAALGPPGAGG